MLGEQKMSPSGGSGRKRVWVEVGRVSSGPSPVEWWWPGSASCLEKDKEGEACAGMDGKMVGSSGSHSS